MSRQVGRQLPFPIGRDLRNPQTIPREPRRNPAIAQCRLETSPHTAWSEIKAMAGGPNPGPNQPGAWTSVSTPLGEHQKTTTPMEQPTTWIENPLRGTTNNITPKTTPCPRQRHTQDNCTTWALAIPRRGYFPQPGVVAHATTPGGRPHRAPIVKGLLSTPAITFAVHRYSGPRVERNRFQGSGAVGDRVPRVAAGGTTRG